MRRLFVYVVMIIMLVVPSVAFSCDFCEFLDYRKRIGLVMEYNIDYNEIYVNPLKWHNHALKAKKYFLLIASRIFEAHDSTGRVTVYDGYSGRKLASYGSWGGMKFY